MLQDFYLYEFQVEGIAAGVAEGVMAPQFLFDIIGFSEILIFFGKLLAFAIGKDKGF